MRNQSAGVRSEEWAMGRTEFTVSRFCLAAFSAGLAKADEASVRNDLRCLLDLAPMTISHENELIARDGVPVHRKLPERQRRGGTKVPRIKVKLFPWSYPASMDDQFDSILCAVAALMTISACAPFVLASWPRRKPPNVRMPAGNAVRFSPECRDSAVQG